MLVDDEVLARARRDDRQAIIDVISMQYPSTFRIAHALTGRADLGDAIVRFAMRRAFKAIVRWKDADAPRRWFRHHTILNARRAVGRHGGTSGADTLVYSSGTHDPAYSAFVLALRSLPYQQREAFLLTQGEQLDIRALATGMDCSTTAAAQHLEIATSRLRELGGSNYDSLLCRLRNAYLNLAPANDLVLSRVDRDTRKYLWPRRAARFVSAIVLLCLIFGIAFIAVKWWRELFVWFKDVISH